MMHFVIARNKSETKDAKWVHDYSCILLQVDVGAKFTSIMLWGNENKHKENNSVAQLERASRRPDAATASLFTDAAREHLENANQNEKGR
jgi:hypothetical protein